MLPRHLRKTLERSLGQFPAVLLIGARRVGKSTLARALAPGKWCARWVHAELRKLLSLEAPQPDLSFWRTRTGQEVDFLIEKGGEVVGLEVKGSGKLDRRQLKMLDACRSAFGKRWRLGVLLHGGTEVVAIDERTAAAPIAMAFGQGPSGPA